ncbi:hypothetical protein F4778DRAFT_789967 [Xylariomycetidae sp. FL2044]|nr:hypothetical protein F4778DRAFT_789967 [Xylariomycetidae sp. FL2044]
MALLEALKQRALESGSRQHSVWGVAIAFIIITLFVMCVRIYVRCLVIKSVGLDDIFMVLGAIFTFGLSVASMIAAYYGKRRSPWQATPIDDPSLVRLLTDKHTADEIILENMTPMLQAIYSTRLLYVVGIMFVKLSLLVFYLRLDPRRSLRYWVFFLMFVVVGFSIASFFILAFSCYPPAVFWDLTGTIKGKCIEANSQQAFYDANGVINIVIDLSIYITPIPMLWNIQISRRQKIALSAIFGLGVIAVAAGCVRFAYVRLLSHTDELYFFLADSLSWCEIEIYVAMICGSASAFRILIRTHFPGLLGSTADKKSYDRKGLSGSGLSGSSRGYLGLGKGRTGKTTVVRGKARRDNDSEELIFQDDTCKSIVVKTEFQMDTLQADGHKDGQPGSSLKSSPL